MTKTQYFTMGLLAAGLMLAPFAAQAGGKPYARFNTDGIYENTSYKSGEAFCVYKRPAPDAELTPSVQYRVIGHSDLKVEKLGVCDSGVMKHIPIETVDTQVQWEKSQGRVLYTAMDNGLEYHFSPGAVFCRDYRLFKVNDEGELKGTGTTCRFEDYPSLDPR